MRTISVFFVSLLLFVLIAVKWHPAAASVSSPTVEVDESTRRQILAATIQIAMYEHAADDAKSERGWLGLGTVVTHGGQQFILTHDHWSALDGNLHEIELRDASGKLVMVLDAASFRRLIRYQDGGTMLLQLPTTLEGLVPARLAYGPAPASGETTWLARRSATNGDASVEVVPALVETLESARAPARLRVRAADGQVIFPGDSGGGLWLDGKLLANTWAAVELREVENFWTRLLGGGSVRATDLIVAAHQPLIEQQEGQGQATKFFK